MDCEQLKIMFWNCRVAENIAFYRVCNIYMQEKKPYILAIMEIRSDPGKLNKDFTRLVLLGLLILIQEALRAVCYGVESGESSNSNYKTAFSIYSLKNNYK